MSETIESTLAERGARYGSFPGHAHVTMDLKRAIRLHLAARNKRLADDQQEALDMICHKILLHRLAAAGGWLGADELRRELPRGETVVDDVIAGLVERGDVQFNPRGRQYRLAGGPAARAAVRRLMLDPRLRRALVGTKRDGEYLVGLARRVADADGAEGVVCAEVAFDYPGAGAVAALATGVAAWLEER